MSFGANVVGFYLQMENQLSPVLVKAEADYKRFTKSLEKLNLRAVNSTRKGMGQMAGLAGAFRNLPKQATVAYDKMLKNLNKRSKPINLPIDFIISPKGKRKFTDMIAEGVSKAFRKAKFRFNAGLPAKRSSTFQSGQPLRSLYQDMPQPPDMMGGVKFQKFNKGVASVPSAAGAVPGKDSVPALLTPGEMVLPEAMASQMRDDMDQLALVVGGEVTDAFHVAATEVHGYGENVKYLQGLQAAGFPVNDEIISQLGEMKFAMERLSIIQHRFNKTDEMKKMAPVLGELRKKYRDIRDELESVSAAAKTAARDADQLANPVRFLATMKALEGLESGLNKMTHVAGAAHDAFGGDQAKSWSEGVEAVNATLHLSRDEMYGLAHAALVAGDKFNNFTDPAMVQAGMGALVKGGIIAKETLTDLSHTIALISVGTHANVDEMGDFAATLMKTFKLSGDEVKIYFANMENFAASAGMGMGDLEKMVDESTHNMSTYFTTLSDESKKNVLSSMQEIAAGTAKALGGPEGKEAAGELTALIADAVNGKDGAIKALSALGVNYQQLGDAMASGDAAPIMSTLASNLKNMSVTGSDAAMAMQSYSEATGHSVTSLGLLAQKNVDIGKTMDGLPAKITDVAGAMGVIGTNAGKQTSTLTGWGNVIKTNLVEVAGRAVSALGEVNFQMIASAVYLTKETIAMGVWIAARWSKTAAVVAGTAAETAATAATTAAAPAAAGLSVAIMALAPAIPVLLGLGAAAILFGAAIWLITPAISALVGGMVEIGKVVGDVFVKSFGMVIDLFKSLTSVSFSDMAGAAGGLIMFGGALPLVGLGILGFSTSLLLAAPGLVAFAGVMKLFGGVGGGGIAAVLNSLVNQFNFDTSKLQKVLAGLSGAMQFIKGFAEISAMIAALSIGATLSSAVDSILGFFGVSSPMEKLAAQGAAVANTINQLLTSFASLAGSTVMSSADSIMGAMQVSARFIQNLGPMISAVRDLGAQAGDLADGVFTNGPLTKLAANADKLFGSIHSVMQSAQAHGITPQMASSAVSSSDVSSTLSMSDQNSKNDAELKATLAGNSILEQILEVLKSGGGPKHTVARSSGGGSSGSSLAADIGRGGY